MTRNEMIAVLERLEEYYRYFYSGIDKERVLNAWYPMFKDDPAEEVNRAVIAYICTEKNAPTVAGIKTIMAENRMTGQMTEMEAWQVISGAVDYATDKAEAIKQYNKLPALLKKLVVNPSRLITWRKLDLNTFEGVIASNVQRSYRELARRESIFYAIPGQLQAEQTWRIDAPKEQIALPEAEKPKSITEVIDEANRSAADHGMIMTDELQEKHRARLDAFLAPMTKEDLKRVEHAENKKAERFLK